MLVLIKVEIHWSLRTMQSRLTDSHFPITDMLLLGAYDAAAVSAFAPAHLSIKHVAAIIEKRSLSSGFIWISLPFI